MSRSCWQRGPLAFTEDQALFAAHPSEVLMAAALTCTDEADFRNRIREAPE